jgi:hypothetical protein
MNLLIKKDEEQRRNISLIRFMQVSVMISLFRHFQPYCRSLCDSRFGLGGAGKYEQEPRLLA